MGKSVFAHSYSISLLLFALCLQSSACKQEPFLIAAKKSIAFFCITQRINTAPCLNNEREAKRLWQRTQGENINFNLTLAEKRELALGIQQMVEEELNKHVHCAKSECTCDATGWKTHPYDKVGINGITQVIVLKQITNVLNLFEKQYGQRSLDARC